MGQIGMEIGARQSGSRLSPLTGGRMADPLQKLTEAIMTRPDATTLAVNSGERAKSLIDEV